MNAFTRLGDRAMLSVSLLVLRVGTGGSMLYGHGWGKLTSFDRTANVFPDPLGLGSTTTLALAVFAEFFCAAAVVLGYATRAAVVPLIATMAVAAFFVHAHDPFQTKELALLYLVPFVALLFTGGGQFSLDRVLWLRLRRRRA